MAIAQSVPASAEQGAFYGLLRSRDLSPFGFLRLDMRPAHAVSIEPGSWAVETELGYQNTWALSPEVEKYLIGLESRGRRRLGPAEMQAIGDLPGENYLLDIETATLDLTLHYKVAPRTGRCTALISAISYQGGFLDSTIERFHDDLGFSSFGRPALARNQAALFYDLKGVHLAFRRSRLMAASPIQLSGSGTPGRQFSPTWRLTLEGAVKIPSGRASELLLSPAGRTTACRRRCNAWAIRHAFYGNLAAVYYAGDARARAAGFADHSHRDSGLRVQVDGEDQPEHPGLYQQQCLFTRQTDLDELLGMKYEYSLGLRHRMDNWLLTFGFTENVQNVNNTPDVGFQVALRGFHIGTRGEAVRVATSALLLMSRVVAVHGSHGAARRISGVAELQRQNLAAPGHEMIQVRVELDPSSHIWQA